MKFKGDIVITDPCYIDTPDDKLWNDKGIEVYDGCGISKYGFTNYIWKSTIYGDWSCTTFHLKDEAVNKEIQDLTDDDIYKGNLGKFCADAGLVGVFLLDEVKAFNPDFETPNKYGVEWATIIKDFDGDIEYIIDDEQAYIKGTGNINFITMQTGL